MSIYKRILPIIAMAAMMDEGAYQTSPFSRIPKGKIAGDGYKGADPIGPKLFEYQIHGTTILAENKKTALKKYNLLKKSKTHNNETNTNNTPTTDNV